MQLSKIVEALQCRSLKGWLGGQAIPSEAEVLLPAGIALKVTSVLSKDASGLTIVTLEDDEEVTRPPLPFCASSKAGRFFLVLTWRRVQAPELVI